MKTKRVITKTKDLSYKQPHRWGYLDSHFVIDDKKSIVFKSSRPEYAFFANQHLPDFIPFIENELQTTIEEEFKNVEVSDKKVPPPIINKSFVTAIKKIFKSTRYSFGDIDRLVHSHGQTTSEEVYKILYRGFLPRLTDMVFFCFNELEAGKIIELAKKYNVCLVPYGGGTSVSNALSLPIKDKRMIVSLNMRSMNRLLWLDKKNRLACLEAGIVGRELERLLNTEGYTMGHEPDSAEFSSLGGWVSTFASGMKKNKYGNIEDMVRDFNFITPQGVIKNVRALDRSSVGLQPKNFVLGSEGNLGLITSVIVKIHELPPVKRYNSLIFKDIDKGIAFLKNLAKSNYLPASIRLVDNPQFRFGLALKTPPSSFFKVWKDALKKYFLLCVKKMNPNKMCLATIVMEGSQEEVNYQEKSITRLAQKYNAVVAGEAHGRRGYLLTNVIAYIRDFIADYHCLGETLESTVPWDKIELVCEKANRTAIREHHKYKLPGKVYFSYRITQLYHSSVCIYFTVAIVTRGVKRADKIFANIEQEIRSSILKSGGTISHHHGVGKIRQKFLFNNLSKTNVKLLRQIKRELDPKNIFGIGNNVMR